MGAREEEVPEALRYDRADGIVAATLSPAGEYADRGDSSALRPRAVQDSSVGAQSFGRLNRRLTVFVSSCLLAFSYDDIG